MLFQIIYFLLDHRFLYYYGPFVINNNIMITIWTDLIKSYYTFKVAVKFSVLLDAVYTSDFFFSFYISSLYTALFLLIFLDLTFHITFVSFN